MNFREFGTKTLSCGTVSYSYKLCYGGYMVRIVNLDTGSERCTVGVDVPSDYITVIMTHLMESDITEDNMDAFLINELNKYSELYPPKIKRTQGKYLYL